jgi:DNA polymerase-1
VGESLRDNLEQVRLNREINQLVTDLELPVTLADLALTEFDRDDVNRVSG